MKKITLIVASVASAAIVLTMAGCTTTPTSSSVYTTRQTQNEQSVRLAVVESVREVMIEKGQTGVGTMTGAALGGIAAGSSIGKGNGAVAAGIVGAVVGGIIGQNIEGNMNNKKGLEITVRLENGEMRAITQDADDQFRAGDRVRLLSRDGVTRVTH